MPSSIDRPDHSREPQPTSRPPLILGAPPLIPVPYRFRPKLGDWCWPIAPHYRGERGGTHVGERIGNTIVVAMYWVPSVYDGRASNAWVELRCDCDLGPTFVIRAGHARRCGDKLACGDCVKARGRPAGPECRSWTGVGSIAGSHLGAIRADAAKRGLRVEVTDEEIADLLEEQGHRCAYSGAPIVSATTRSERTPSLERIAGTGDYHRNGICFTHKHVNVARRAYPLADFVALTEAVAAHTLRLEAGLPPLPPVAVEEDASEPPMPTLVSRLERKLDADGRVRSYGTFRCHRCNQLFRSRAGNIQSGNTRSCGCWGTVTRGLATRLDADRLGAIRANYVRELRRSAELRGHEFTLTPEELRDMLVRQGGRCALTGLPLNVRGRTGLASVDRIDPHQGYVTGNARLVTPMANLCRHLRTDEEFRALCKGVAGHLGARWVDRRYVPSVRQLVQWAAEAV